MHENLQLFFVTELCLVTFVIHERQRWLCGHIACYPEALALQEITLCVGDQGDVYKGHGTSQLTNPAVSHLERQGGPARRFFWTSENVFGACSRQQVL